MKTNYHAWVTQAEHDAIARVLATCPGEPLPTAGAGRERVVPTHTKPAPEPIATATAAPRKSGSGSSPRRAQPTRTVTLPGRPARRRSPAAAPDYDANPNLDRDDDGVACESYVPSQKFAGTYRTSRRAWRPPAIPHVHPVCAGITSGPSHDDRARYLRANFRLATLAQRSTRLPPGGCRRAVSWAFAGSGFDRAAEARGLEDEHGRLGGA